MASNATEALRISEEHKGAIDLLLTDVVLPGMNGRELARHLSRKRPSSKVLYISGYDQDTVGVDALELKSGAFLFKPFGSRELLDAVSEVLDEKNIA
jgi:DNA-binding response OmpR family regulator